MRFLKRRESVFITGAAGKSLECALRRRPVANAASRNWEDGTFARGAAAVLLGGTTIHSWGGLPTVPTHTDLVVDKIRNRKEVSQRWKSAKILIIDEGMFMFYLSLLSGQMFQQLAEVAARIRCGPALHFGGLTLLVYADFFQLPPVHKDASPYFAFQSNAWMKVFKADRTVVLSSVYRHQTSDLLSMLNDIRLGILTDETLSLLRRLERPLPTLPFGPVELFARREDVDHANNSRLSAIKSVAFTYRSKDYSSCQPARAAALFRDMVAPANLELRIDAQVMLLRNVATEAGLTSGSVGKVIGFYQISEVVPKEATSSQASFARNIHVDDEGTPLTALANIEEVRTSKCTTLTPPDTTTYPLVAFPNAHGKPCEAILIMNAEFVINDAQGRPLARRHQIPLVLAWAMSIHRSQGMNLHRVRVDMQDVREHGQAYVALSRCASLDGLQVVNFHPSRVKVHKDVQSFYRDIGRQPHHFLRAFADETFCG
ncbi:hypothetical protein ONZ45_g9699 [Pleurotus djamor]|nr:hypothetical protein ONZ45_g9699 [Pleurotus djamor]